jgi:hypothetical protein
MMSTMHQEPARGSVERGISAHATLPVTKHELKREPLSPLAAELDAANDDVRRGWFDIPSKTAAADYRIPIARVLIVASFSLDAHRTERRRRATPHVDVSRHEEILVAAAETRHRVAHESAKLSADADVLHRRERVEPSYRDERQRTHAGNGIESHIVIG